MAVSTSPRMPGHPRITVLSLRGPFISHTVGRCYRSCLISMSSQRCVILALYQLLLTLITVTHGRCDGQGLSGHARAL
jgi:hypothetical protein